MGEFRDPEIGLVRVINVHLSWNMLIGINAGARKKPD